MDMIDTDNRDSSSVEVGKFVVHMKTCVFQTWADSLLDGCDHHLWDYSYPLASNENVLRQVR